MTNELPTNFIEKKLKAQCFIIALQCSKCFAICNATGKASLTQPQKYQYKCPICGHEEWSPNFYPTPSFEAAREEAKTGMLKKDL